MTFKYTEEDEYHLTGILEDLFPKVAVDVNVISKLVGKEKSKHSKQKSKLELIQFVTGVEEYDINHLAGEYFSDLIQKHDVDIHDPKDLERKVEADKNNSIRGSRFISESLSLSFLQKPDPLFFAEAIYLAQKEGFNYSIIESKLNQHFYDVELSYTDSYQSILKTIRGLQNTEAEMRLETLNIMNYSVGKEFEKQQVLQEVEEIRNEFIVPVPVIAFTRVESYYQNKEIDSERDLLEENVCLFFMPSSNFIGTFFDNGFYAYKKGSNEIFQFDNAETLQASSVDLERFKSYINR